MREQRRRATTAQQPPAQPCSQSHHAQQRPHGSTCVWPPPHTRCPLLLRLTDPPFDRSRIVRVLTLWDRVAGLSRSCPLIESHDSPKRFRWNHHRIQSLPTRPYHSPPPRRTQPIQQATAASRIEGQARILSSCTHARQPRFGVGSAERGERGFKRHTEPPRHTAGRLAARRASPQQPS